MSEKCSCGQPSKGSIGMLRYCYRCFAELIGYRANDKRLKRPITVQLWNDDIHQGTAEWIPDAAISQAREVTR